MIHKRIIGFLWLIFGALLIAVVAMNMAGLSPRAAVAGVLISLVFFGAGVALLANVRRMIPLYLICSVLCLFIFPIGTVVGAYYFWYYFTIEKLHPK
ncbi:MAG: hypothetical protein V1879_05005 [Pseudomonadota bacterium]